MRIPEPLTRSWDKDLEQFLESELKDHGWVPEEETLTSKRFLTRSVLPHLERLLKVFNRVEADTVDRYWKTGSHPDHLRLAYVLGFFPSNSVRVSGVFAELYRYGFRFPTPAKGALKAIDLGSGPGSVTTGATFAQKVFPDLFPETVSWALIEQDRKILHWSEKFLTNLFNRDGLSSWSTRLFHRTLDDSKTFLPPTAPKFHLWCQSFFSNELTQTPAEIAEKLLLTWEKHLEDEGLVVLVEPALKAESRRLLEIRKELIRISAERNSPFQILLPCLGHQACGALANEQDWCHEEVTWWRPQFYQRMDELGGMDRKILPFSYLVAARTRKTVAEYLPEVGKTKGPHYRLVSPPHKEGKDLEFFVCGQTGKQKARFRPEDNFERDAIKRGVVLSEVKIRGDSNAARIESAMIGEGFFAQYAEVPEPEDEALENDWDENSENEEAEE